MSRTDHNSPRRSSISLLAEIQPGYLSRSRVHANPDGTHRLLQAKDLTPQGTINWSEVVRFEPERNPALYEIRAGDIVLLARGRNHPAVLITDAPADTLASSVFYILRPLPDRVVSSYLAWWLNLPEVQSDINAVSRGTGIGYVKRQSLEDIAVNVPPVDVQRRIEAIVSLRRRQASLQLRLEDKRSEVIEAICRRAASIETGATR